MRFSTVAVDEKVLLGYVCDIVFGLDYLYLLYIVYMDFKLENMFLCIDGEVKFVDFGVSFIYDLVSFDGVEKRFVGTLVFLVFEVFLEDGYDLFKVDIWFLGVCFYNMVMGKLLFLGKMVY